MKTHRPVCAVGCRNLRLGRGSVRGMGGTAGSSTSAGRVRPVSHLWTPTPRNRGSVVFFFSFFFWGLIPFVFSRFRADNILSRSLFSVYTPDVGPAGLMLLAETALLSKAWNLVSKASKLDSDSVPCGCRWAQDLFARGLRRQANAFGFKQEPLKWLVSCGERYVQRKAVAW